MSQSQAAAREARAKTDPSFVDELVDKAAALESEGALEDALSVLEEAIVVQGYHDNSLTV